MKEIEDNASDYTNNGNLISSPNSIPSKSYQDYMIFRPIRENQMLKETVTSNSFSKSSFLDPHPHDMLYKVLKTDAKIVRSVL